jgi:hypothetical protein
MSWRSAPDFWPSCLNWRGRNNSHATILFLEIAGPGECRLSSGRVPGAIITQSTVFDLLDFVIKSKCLCRQLKIFTMELKLQSSNGISLSKLKLNARFLVDQNRSYQ